MRAIVTKYHGPANVRGAKISASNDNFRVTVDYPHEVSGNENKHRVALAAHLAKDPYHNEDERDPNNWVGGWFKEGYVFVYAGK